MILFFHMKLDVEAGPPVHTWEVTPGNKSPKYHKIAI